MIVDCLKLKYAVVVPAATCLKSKHITLSLVKRKLKMKSKKMMRKARTHIISNEPDDITLELAKTMAEIKEDYDLPTEEVAKTVATVNNNRFRNIFKKILDS